MSHTPRQHVYGRERIPRCMEAHSATAAFAGSPKSERVAMIVSVISVALNDRDGLAQTWESIRIQEDRSYEWIVVDGGSADGTAEWLTTLPREVHWTSEPDSGIYAAMNKGAARANGDIVLFLNSGDRLASPTTLTSVTRSYAQDQWGWAYGSVAVQGVAGDYQEIKSFMPFNAVLLALGLKAVPHPGCYFTRELFVRLGGYDTAFPIAADQELCLRASEMVRPVVLPAVLAVFMSDGVSSRQRAGSFVLQARQMRRNHSRFVGGGALRDGLLTVVLFAMREAQSVLTGKVTSARS